MEKRKLSIQKPFFFENNELIDYVKFAFPSDDKQSEFIRDLIYDNPSLIPINEMSEDYSPLIPLGKSIVTESGEIDCLFINPEGNLVLVETKVRGKIHPKIFDIRYDLQNWTFENLDKLAQKNYGKSLIDLLSKNSPTPIDSGELYTRISDNFLNTKFLLLIVSERMNSFVEKLFLKFPQTNNTSHFGLVKLNMYKHPRENRLVIQPSSAFSNAPVTATQKIVFDKNSAEKIEHREFSSDEERFFDKLEERVSPEIVKFSKQIATDTEKIGCIIEWKPTSLIIKFPNPKNQKKLLTLFMIQIYGECVHGDIEEQFERYHYPESIAKNFLNSLIFQLGFKKGSLHLDYLKPNYKKFLDLIQSTLEEIQS